MEIKKIVHGTSPLLNTDANEKGKVKDDLFKKMLEGASSQYHDGPESISPGAGGISQDPLAPLAPLASSPNLSDPAQVRLQSIESTEKTLGLLEQYQKALANPNQSLKSIYPLVQSLSQELQDLHRLSETLSPSDPLQPILTQTGVVSAVEIEKFHRGEYI